MTRMRRDSRLLEPNELGTPLQSEFWEGDANRRDLDTSESRD